MTSRHDDDLAREMAEMRAWLGPRSQEMPDDQVAELTRVSRMIDAHYPGADRQPERDAALIAVLEHLTGESTPPRVRATLERARVRERDARVAAIWTAVMLTREGMEQLYAAQEVGVSRNPVREALGLRAPRRAGAAVDASTE